MKNNPLVFGVHSAIIGLLEGNEAFHMSYYGSTIGYIAFKTGFSIEDVYYAAKSLAAKGIISIEMDDDLEMESCIVRRKNRRSDVSGL